MMKKMGPWNTNKIGFIIIIIILFAQLFAYSLASSSRIEFENGKYNGLFIGIDGEKLSKSECPEILTNLKTLIEEFSEKLFEATEGRASIGVVNILLPSTWEPIGCQLPETPGYILTAGLNQSFRYSHIQITKNHSIADFLPWTRQFRPCGQQSDSIVIPFKFLSNDNTTQPPSTPFSNSVKAQLLLHEWAKFRYGVFDEIGYEEDQEEETPSPDKQLFPPCYAHSDQAHLTTCSSPRLAAVVQNTSVCTLDLLMRYKDKLAPILAKSPTSVMSSPYLDTVVRFCNQSSHNRWALTKQNFYCQRKSVAEVVFSHPDFSASPTQPSFPSSIVPDIRILRHASSSVEPAYAIVIEDSEDMQDQYKLLHVKQAIAQFLEILDLDTEVLVIIFSADHVGDPTRERLKSDFEKQKILGMIPDIRSSESTWKDGGGQRVEKHRSISSVIDLLVRELEKHQSFSWNVLLFSNPPDPINDFQSAIKTFQNTSHTLSIFTFENSTDLNDTKSDAWLEWYTIPNTQNIVALPFCTQTDMPKGPCTFQTSSFILDQLIGLLNDQQFNTRGHRFLQSGAQIVLPYFQGQSKTFHLEGQVDQVKQIYLFMTLPPSKNPDPSTTLIITPPSGIPCTAEYLLTYDLLVKFGGVNCSFQSGEWMVEINNNQSGIPSVGGALLLNIYLEMNEAILEERLLVTSSLNASIPPSNPLSPNSNIYPVYVTLQTMHGNPILDAQVTLQVFYPSLFSNPSLDKINGTEIVLRDDGNNNGPDQTRNDGVYSAYLSGFSPKRKAFHLVQLQVTTTANTAILEMAKPSKAILLDERMTNKCCGQSIGRLTTKSVPANIKFQTLHLGFKTNDPWASTLLYPPASITDFDFADNSETNITVEFTGVFGDKTGNYSVNVTSYEACCVASNVVQKMELIPHPEEDDCKSGSVTCDEIKEPGAKQTCSMSKPNLVKLWVPAENKSEVDNMICSLRAVNTNSQYGDISQMTVAVNVSAAIAQQLASEAEASKCHDILNDNCVPLWVFWVLIGCVGGVLLLLLVVVCCWCFCSRRNKREQTRSTVESGSNPRPQKENVLAVHYSQPSSNPPQNSASNNNDPPKVVKELFVNHAYIQDGDGEIKIITDNGQILRKSKNDDDDDDEQNTLPQKNLQPKTNMQVFKPVPMHKPIHSRAVQNPNSRSKRHVNNERPQIIHPNPMLRSDSTYDDTLGRQLPPLPPQKHEAPLPPQYIPPKRNNPEPAVVYASISRSSRFTKPPAPKSPKQVTFDPHYMVPHSSVAVPQNSTLLRRQQASESALHPSRAPPHIPNYPPPFSDSETSTDFDVYKKRAAASRRVPPQFTKPPPYPAGSQLVLNNQQQRPNLNDNTNFRGGGMPNQSQTLPVGIAPPVPPPRYDRSTVPPKIRQNNNSAIQNFTTKREMGSTDDDSDEWDDGDNYEFDNATGVSYA